MPFGARDASEILQGTMDVTLATLKWNFEYNRILENSGGAH